MKVFAGTPVSPGYGEGVAFPYRRKEYLLLAAQNTAARGDEETELARLASAREAARNELQALARNLKQTYALDELEIFHSHFLILDDDVLTGLMRDRIAKGGSAEAAVAEAVASVEEMFRKQVDPYIRERAIDIHDVGTRLVRHLADSQHHPFAQLPEGAVLLADELLPSDTVFLHRGRVRAIVTEQGSEDSHAAILSRAFGIPAVTGVPGIVGACTQGDPVSVDGEKGTVYLHMEASTGAEYAFQAEGYRTAVEEIRRLPDHVVTLDGTHIALLANVDREEDIDAAIDNGAAGIGLLRTEILCLGKGAPTSEAYQEEIFRYAARRMGDRPVNVRILDLAPDKPLPLSGDTPLAGAAIMDCGIHFALAHPELLRPQLRAIARAAEDGNLRILLPGVTGVSEIATFRTFFDEVVDEIYGSRIGYRIPIGAMIETPSALLMLADIAAVTDFLSLGTNDLLRHLFGRDRGRIQESTSEPSLLRAIDMASRLAAESGQSLAICGEMAGNPARTSLLVGLGLRTLSMSPQRLPQVRYNVSQTRLGDATELARHSLRLATAADIGRLIETRPDPWHRLIRDRESGATEEDDPVFGSLRR